MNWHSNSSNEYWVFEETSKKDFIFIKLTAEDSQDEHNKELHGFYTLKQLT